MGAICGWGIFVDGGYLWEDRAFILTAADTVIPFVPDGTRRWAIFVRAAIWERDDSSGMASCDKSGPPLDGS
jgi:hypothetical protein